MLREFVLTVYYLVRFHKWNELKEYFRLIKELEFTYRVIITPGKPKDKENI